MIVEFDKLEAPLYSVTITCVTEFLMRFAEQAIPLIHGLANKVIQSNKFIYVNSIYVYSTSEDFLLKYIDEMENLPGIIRDGLFAMIGQLTFGLQAAEHRPFKFPKPR